MGPGRQLRKFTRLAIQDEMHRGRLSLAPTSPEEPALSLSTGDGRASHGTSVPGYRLCRPFGSLFARRVVPPPVKEWPGKKQDLSREPDTADPPLHPAGCRRNLGRGKIDRPIQRFEHLDRFNPRIRIPQTSLRLRIRAIFIGQVFNRVHQESRALALLRRQTGGERKAADSTAELNP